MLRSAGRSLERVVVFGLEGVGKSECALDVATRIGDYTLWVIDNDNAWDRMLEGETLTGATVKVREEYRWVDGEWFEETDYTDPDGNVVLLHVDGWDANVAAVEVVVARAERWDWCCLDSGSALWPDVQDWYTNKVFSRNLADQLIALKVEGDDAKEDDDKWQVINAVYAKGVGKFLVNPPCHLIVMAEQKEVNSSKERDKQTKATYGDAGFRPAGQKRMGHNVQTIIRLVKNSDNTYYAFTIKDRGGRNKLVREDITGYGFSQWYLEEVAGWVEDDEAEAEQAVPVAKSAPVAKG